MSEAERMPDELGLVEELVSEFLNKLSSIDNEIELLKQDRKELIEEYQDRIDFKTLNKALRVVKIEKEVQHRDTYDVFMAVLKKD